MGNERAIRMLPTLQEKFDACYVSTNNQMGFMLTKVDPLIQGFVDYAAKDSSNWHLDVGAAFGIATIAALQRGAKMVANDLDESHLKIIGQACRGQFEGRVQFCLGDIKNEVEYTSASFGSVLFSRVLHFFSGEGIIGVLRKVSE